jgi:hypothetical protein
VEFLSPQDDLPVSVLLLTIANKRRKIIVTTFMSFNKDTAVQRAKQDLAGRLGISENDITASASEKDFPDMSLGAPASGEMSAQMISRGWQIDLSAGGKHYEYRADKYQLRLKGFKGTNHVVVS